MKVCSTCNKQVSHDFVEFRFPGSSGSKVVRCFKCRAEAKTYSDKESSYVGP